MILKILLINIFCSFKCSVSRNTGNLNTCIFNLEESLSEIIENEGIDLNNIVTSVTPLLLDVLIIITQEACLLWEDKFDMDESYLLNITRYAKKLIEWIIIILSNLFLMKKNIC
ncbi:hypothetical protein HZS_790 [Henneguya salminicola]|nr:hypothetical protein HZS_790 [Henneguya salminicola]